jgi:hypothetical protein
MDRPTGNRIHPEYWLDNSVLRWNAVAQLLAQLGNPLLFLCLCIFLALLFEAGWTFTHWQALRIFADPSGLISKQLAKLNRRVVDFEHRPNR